MSDPGRMSFVVVAIGAVTLLVVAPLLFLGGPGAGLAAPAPTPTPGQPPAPSPSAPPPPASPRATATPPPASPPASPAAAPSPGAPVVTVVDVTLSQEVPAPQPQTPRTAAASGAVVINTVRTEVGYAFTFTGLSGNLTAAHFHRAERGVAGPVVQTICGAPDAISGACPAAMSGTVAGVWRNVPAAMMADLVVGRL